MLSQSSNKRARALVDDEEDDDAKESDSDNADDDNEEEEQLLENDSDVEKEIKAYIPKSMYFSFVVDLIQSRGILLLYPYCSIVSLFEPLHPGSSPPFP